MGEPSFQVVLLLLILLALARIRVRIIDYSDSLNMERFINSRLLSMKHTYLMWGCFYSTTFVVYLMFCLPFWRPLIQRNFCWLKPVFWPTRLSAIQVDRMVRWPEIPENVHLALPFKCNMNAWSHRRRYVCYYVLYLQNANLLSQTQFCQSGWLTDGQQKFWSTWVAPISTNDYNLYCSY